MSPATPRSKQPLLQARASAYLRTHQVDRLGHAIQIENLYRDIFGQCNDYVEGLQNTKR
jgi:hypothetical protein